MKLKVLAAAVALAFAGSANAAFYNDNTTTGVAFGNGTGSVVLSVVDDTATVDTSIAIDLGITSSDLLNGAVSTGTLLTGNTDLNNFLSSATGTIKWDVTSINNDAGTYDLGVLQTVVGGTMPPHFDADVFNAMNRQGAWMNGIAGVAAGNVAHFADATMPGGHFDFNHANSPASPNPYPTNGLLGETVDMLAILAGYGPNGYGMSLETMTLDFTGGNATLTYGPVSAVPIPAAAWLFGSAMLGMVGVARRRSAA